MCDRLAKLAAFGPAKGGVGFIKLCLVIISGNPDQENSCQLSISSYAVYNDFASFCERPWCRGPSNRIVGQIAKSY